MDIRKLVPNTGRFNKKNDKFKKNKQKPAPEVKKKKWQLIDEEVAVLKTKYSEINSSKVEKFTDFPLSKLTLDGLSASKYSKPTDIQRESIGLALQGHDILGAAKTGSGKTLAFLIPILEHLYREKWTPLDGMGALIISPTRELAFQTFQVLKKIGTSHDFSAGLVIGGKHVREEKERMTTTNIVVCTPGRLLQHMEETFNFTADALQILVLDEADRILDLGFAEAMNAIIENLPASRQTLLFSATQTKSVKDLARLSLKDPMYVSVHEHATHSTPAKLEQSYIVCELHHKINVLWSFVKNHLYSKVLVFISCCKLVRYIHEAFRILRPGQTILALHGGMNQIKRMEVYDMFCRKKHAVLFATDIAARGLDIPAVNWVVQMDCPEDVNTYIHRVGRTARFEQNGEALLILLPSEEEAMVKQLIDRKIPINQIKVNQQKIVNLKCKLEANCASCLELKAMAQRAFKAYIKNIYLMKNKKVFDVTKLDTELYARSIGLAFPPRIRFLQKHNKQLASQKPSDTDPYSKHKTFSDSEGEGEEQSENESSGEQTEDKMVCAYDSGNHSKSNAALGFEVDDEGEQLFSVKNIDVDVPEGFGKIDMNMLTSTKNRTITREEEVKKKQKLARKANVSLNKKIVFDEGKEESDEEDVEEKKGLNIELAKKRMEEADKSDKELYRQLIKQRKRDEKIKLKEKKKAELDEMRKRLAAEDGEEDEEVEVVFHKGDVDDDQDPLDFIPDPDQIYNNTDQQSYSDDDEEEEDDERPKTKKQKIEVKSESESEDDDDDDTSDEDKDVSGVGASLPDDEELALRLLQKY
ncbi:probable ATP-dependent RNA helicase DDX10 [Patella vulgata]|uniref:probable ATP-dependent RNA helicase DDX10 n=1 Tax=Patella vulgata TaxID=6465 RepID=UPI0024A8F351|nr:probable ATP-dependent RNA helicase DDX10 [Patella vulgata]